mgnify:CR=1 FL=1
MEIIFATNNKNKLKEIQSLVPEGIILKSLSDIGCFDEIPETGTTLHANAKLKSDYIVERYKVNCFSDDTGLEIEALKPNSELSILNRWGNVVYMSTNYQNDWNGSYANNGNNIPDASSYYYQIDLDGNGSIDYDGWIYISK